MFLKKLTTEAKELLASRLSGEMLINDVKFEKVESIVYYRRIYSRKAYKDRVEYEK